jgi:aromatic ring-cleaving dioxygenase
MTLLLQTNYEASGPFLTAQTAVFIPVNLYEQAVSFMVKNRGRLDVFIHPNSGCGVEDHLLHGLWGGNRWEIDGSIFFD